MLCSCLLYAPQFYLLLAQSPEGASVPSTTIAPVTGQAMLQELAQARAARMSAAQQQQAAPPVQQHAPMPVVAQRPAAPAGVDGLTLLAGVLTTLIAAIVLRRILIIGGFDVTSL